MKFHYQVTVGVHCHVSVPVLIWPPMLAVCKTRNNQLAQPAFSICFTQIRILEFLQISNWEVRNLSGDPETERLEFRFLIRVVCLLLYYVLAIATVILGQVSTCDSTHTWWVYSADTTWFPTQSHYPDTEPTIPCLILIMPSTWLGSDKYQFYTSLVWLD